MIVWIKAGRVSVRAESLFKATIVILGSPTPYDHTRPNPGTFPAPTDDATYPAPTSDATITGGIA